MFTAQTGNTRVFKPYREKEHVAKLILASRLLTLFSDEAKLFSGPDGGRNCPGVGPASATHEEA